jgi:hypothetical protein
MLSPFFDVFERRREFPNSLLMRGMGKKKKKKKKKKEKKKRVR